jgi:drug/metabolite transporter (DMT)-like permease
MGEALVALAGTPAGDALAAALALLSALAHAVFGAINKGGRDPYLNRGAINLAYGAMAAPVALFVTPWPTPGLWATLAAVWAVHILYEWLQARGYAIGGFTVVYPIARGTGPLVTVIAAGVVFGERFAPLQWAGLLTLTGAIYGLAWANLRALGLADLAAARRLRAAILTALATGVMIAVYTTLDAWGIRQAADPFTFLAWFFTLGGLGFPLVAAARWRRLPTAARPDPRGLALRGVVGALVAFVSFGAAMLATRVGHVGEAAALRETSIVFATAIGVAVFRERLDATRLALIGAIVVGAALVKAG